MVHQIASLRGNSSGLSARFNGRVLPALLALGTAVIMQNAGVANAAAPSPQSYGLFNTGIDPGIMEGLDNHYTVSYEEDPVAKTFGAPAATYVTDMTGLPFNPPDDATSAFVSPQPSYAAGQIDAGGEYDFTTTFNLTGVDLSTFSLYGAFESDDRIDDVLVNGHSLGIALADPDYYGFSQYFNLVTSNDLFAGPGNKITFQLFNFTNSFKDPVALRAEFSATVPEPSTWVMVGGLTLLVAAGSWLRHRRATV